MPATTFVIARPHQGVYARLRRAMGPKQSREAGASGFGLLRRFAARKDAVRCLRALLIGLALFGAAASAIAQTDPYYKGKRLTVLINFTAGGPTDVEGRLFARHLGDHIAGHPQVIVQNMDGGGGMIGAGYLGEVAPKDGTMVGYFTGTAWRYANDPERFRVDFRSYDFLAYQPGTTVYYARTDVPPGLKDATDIVKAQGLIAGGLGAENAKDLLIRLALDMLGVSYRYVTPFPGSQAARLALQRNEINFYSESPPSYRAVIAPSLVKDGTVLPIFFDPDWNGESLKISKQVEDLPILPFQELYRKIKGSAPAGQLWDAYLTVLSINSAMQRTIVLPPHTAPAAITSLRDGIIALNNDKDYSAEAVKTLGYAPEWVAGEGTETQIRRALSITPEMRSFIANYVKNAKR
jgi:tripartite-type tricarboxylate transporter receptor subunit TctC